MKPTILMTLLFTFSVSFAQQNWIEVYSANSESVPNKVCFFDQSNSWGILGGNIYYSNDCGASWEIQYSNSDYSFDDVFFVNDQTGWVVGWSEVLKTSNGGLSWEIQELPNPLGLDVCGVYFIDQDTGWISGSYRTIYVTYDGGENWTIQQEHSFSGSHWLYEIRFWDSQVGCAVGGPLLGAEQGIIYNTIDGGITWNLSLPEVSEEFTSVQFISPDTVWVGDQSDRLYRSVDGGINWDFHTYFYGPGDLSVRDFHFFNNNKAIALLGPYRWAVTDNAWQDYEIIELGIYNRLTDFSFNSSNEGLAVGYNNFWFTQNEGESWDYMNKKFNVLEFSSELTGWMSTLSPDKRLYKTNNGGVVWEEVNSPQNSPIVSIDFVSNNEGYFSTENGMLFKTIDLGNTWQSVELPVSINSISKIQYINSDTGYIIANQNNLLKTTDGSLSWTIMDNFQTDYLTDLHFLNGYWGSLVGSGGYTATTPDGGINWDFTIVSETNPAKIFYRNQNYGYFVSNYSSLYRTSNGGHNWLASNLSTMLAVDIAFSDFNTGWVVDWNSVNKTSNGGQSWDEEISGTSLGINSLITGFSMIDEETAFFCTSAGKVFAYDQTSSINITAKESTLRCFPNPTNGITILSGDEKFSGKENLYLFDISGKKIDRFDFYYKSGDFVIDLSLLQKGIYILQTENFPLESIKLLKK